jgi:hypothetical protein
MPSWRKDLKRKFEGKLFDGNGPYYCPAGFSWDDLKEMVAKQRRTHHVRIVKRKIRKDDATILARTGNTHVVWIYTRKK